MDAPLIEKLMILTADQSTVLNQRDERLETCRHHDYFLFTVSQSSMNEGEESKSRECSTIYTLRSVLNYLHRSHD